ncbi:tyrosinase family oxidase copper chaperone [Streptomyces sp. NPDC048696]|uniref:tyrosinase family oxidase copper chaperone n=1 Tax=Streptomyces sp. NPDC048696 TaxID=3365585 RepID=UPI00372197B0
MISEDPADRRRPRSGLRRLGAAWPGRPRWTAPASTRRGVLRGLFTLSVVTFTGGTLARITAAPRAEADPGAPTTAPTDPTSTWLGQAFDASARPGPPASFDETYRGRRIQGRIVPTDVSVEAHPAGQAALPTGALAPAAAKPHLNANPASGAPNQAPGTGQHGPAGASHAGPGPGFEALIDGRRLHLMRRADGTYLSAVDHYTSYPTPLEAVRAAVDELGRARLAATPLHGT